jgi:cytochrome bd-type quinol oxidase subunit 2
MIVMVALCLGVALGVACGGSVSNLGFYELRWEKTLLALFVVQAVARGRILGSALPGAVWIWTVASGGLAVALLINYRKPGMAVAAIAVLLNLDATLINSGMPVFGSPSEVGAAIAGSRGLYTLTGTQTIAGWLGDVMPVDLGHASLLISVGDVLLLAAVVAALASGMAPLGCGTSNSASSSHSG